jgi:hypothetical protein
MGAKSRSIVHLYRSGKPLSMLGVVVAVYFVTFIMLGTFYILFDFVARVVVVVAN